MNDTRRDSETRDSEAADPAVSEAYRSVANERAPAELDKTVLRAAARELDRDRWFGWFVPYFRPAAFAATACLCLAVVLELNQTVTSVPDPALDGDAADMVDDFASAAAEGASRFREIGATATETTQLSQTTGAAAGPRYCDDDAVATAESWWRCVQDLRAAGRLAEAGSEARRLLEAHPDFRIRRED